MNMVHALDETDNLFTEIKELFLSDNKNDILEQNLNRGLHLLLSD